MEKKVVVQVVHFQVEMADSTIQVKHRAFFRQISARCFICARIAASHRSRAKIKNSFLAEPCQMGKNEHHTTIPTKTMTDPHVSSRENLWMTPKMNPSGRNEESLQIAFGRHFF
jgi:hypothetical protein